MGWKASRSAGCKITKQNNTPQHGSKWEFMLVEPSIKRNDSPEMENVVPDANVPRGTLGKFAQACRRDSPPTHQPELGDLAAPNLPLSRKNRGPVHPPISPTDQMFHVEHSSRPNRGFRHGRWRALGMWGWDRVVGIKKCSTWNTRPKLVGCHRTVNCFDRELLLILP